MVAMVQQNFSTSTMEPLPPTRSNWITSTEHEFVYGEKFRGNPVTGGWRSIHSTITRMYFRGSMSGGQSGGQQVDRRGYLCECDIRPSAVPDMYEIEDFELWVDAGGNIVRLSMSSTVNRQVERTIGQVKEHIHVGHASGFRRATLQDVKDMLETSRKARAKDEGARRAVSPIERERSLVKMALEMTSEMNLDMAGKLSEAMAVNLKALIDTKFQDLREELKEGQAVPPPPPAPLQDSKKDAPKGK